MSKVEKERIMNPTKKEFTILSANEMIFIPEAGKYYCPVCEYPVKHRNPHILNVHSLDIHQ